ncbi:xylosylprotein 4-beta-galactosyltransferase [Coccinella septempunctata]|uniref:xylosylprotein 4-beta-galactosyltransferase n=1 Tax=Coccinella septempunctata TaxID=41139 RepID=UPI001D08C42B|nr:xylosylprotein 4-beta-galactosyltransferase [Coccinella septempunctata]
MKFKSKARPFLLPIYFHKEKAWSTFSLFMGGILIIMFLMTVVLSMKLLNATDCKSDQIIIRYVANNIPNIEKIDASSKHRLGIIVPYRDRFEELLEFIPYMHSFLEKQQISYDIFVVNQVDNYRFNRASLINVGYLQIKSNYDYFAMHDVDLLPLNENLSYAYPEQPYHLAAPNLHPRYHYAKFIGGIFLINREHFEMVNGLSNQYWGWGLEDDEFYVRLKESNLKIVRPENITTGINNTFRHIHSKDRKRDTIKCYNQREVTRKRDRNTGLHNVNYKIISWNNLTIDNLPFTLINVKLHCDFKVTPWCNCTSTSKSPTNEKNKEPGKVAL